MTTENPMPTGDMDPDRDHATNWNEQAGLRWVALQQDLDVQLEPLGVALADRLELVSGERVLDIGCGAGATSLMLAERVRPGHVVGLDISGALLARARERAAGIDNLRFEEGDAQTFPFPGASYDLLFSRFGVMFFDDPASAFRNLATALRPKGKLGFVCWRAMRENPAFMVPLEAAAPFLPEPPEPPEPGAPGPFAFADGDWLRRLLTNAGYADIDIAAHDSEFVLGGLRDLEGTVEMTLQVGPLGRAAYALDPAALERIRVAVRAALLPYHRPSGVTLRAATWIVTARRGATT